MCSEKSIFAVPLKNPIKTNSRCNEEKKTSSFF
jgi:hypothetical protein